MHKIIIADLCRSIAKIINMRTYSFHGHPHQRARVDKKCVKHELFLTGSKFFVGMGNIGNLVS
jgi:hypothetical protein